MKRFKIGFLALVAILAMSFTISSKLDLAAKTAYTCTTSDFDIIKDLTPNPDVTYDNDEDGGSVTAPPAADCFQLLSSPLIAFSCSDTGTKFCCAEKEDACTVGLPPNQVN